MKTKRTWIYLFLAMFVALGAYLVFGSSDERRVLSVLRTLAQAISAQPGDSESRHTRIASALRSHTVESLVAYTPELGTVDGRAAVLALLTETQGAGMSVAIQESEVRIAPETKQARANLVTRVTLRIPGMERHEERDVVVLLEREKDAYRVTRVEVGSPSRVEPEARP